jgi:multidrug efflux pump subunit AcrA (membrane-fusion protein)
VHFELPTDPHLVTLPSTALVTGNQGTKVAVLDSNDKVVLRSVQLGRDLGDSVEVTAGLSPSDRIVNNPPETLASGETVRVAAATPQPAAPASPAPPSKPSQP